MMSAIFNLKTWRMIAAKGTSGDQVDDILDSWQDYQTEVEKEIASLKDELATYKTDQKKSEESRLKWHITESDPPSPIQGYVVIDMLNGFEFTGKAKELDMVLGLLSTSGEEWNLGEINEQISILDTKWRLF